MGTATRGEFNPCPRGIANAQLAHNESYGTPLGCPIRSRQKAWDMKRIYKASIAFAAAAVTAGVVQLVTEQAASASSSFKASATLNGRSGPSLSANIVKTDMYKAGQRIRVVCQIRGGSAYGSNIWDKTHEGVYVADAYVKTGHDGFAPGIPRCQAEQPNPPSSGHGYPAKTDLNGRRSKTTSAATVKVYKSGSTVKVSCQAYGKYAYGSYIWDKTTDGLWVTDAFVKTGYEGFVPGLGRCDNDKPTGGPSKPGNPGGGLTCATVGHGDLYSAPGPQGGTASQKFERVVTAALGQTGRGLPYSWGGGGRSGPTCGEGISPGGYNDQRVVGFDCSGLTQYAFWHGAGVNIGTYTGAQAGKGKRVSISSTSQLRRGDLIFWGSPGSTTHVAVYLGNGKIVEAAPPRNGTSVHVRSIYGTHTYAVRLFS